MMELPVYRGTLLNLKFTILYQKVYSYTYDDMKTLYAYTDLDKYYENDNTILDIYSEKPNAADAYNYDLSNIIKFCFRKSLDGIENMGCLKVLFMVYIQCIRICIILFLQMLELIN